MNTVVVDASLVVKWVVNAPDSQLAQDLFVDWTSKGFVMLAPALLIYEATNSFYKYVRIGEISLEDVERGFRKAIFPIVVLSTPNDASFTLRAIELAQQFNLPATYDAHYLALAERENCELWTADMRMWKAVKDKLNWVHNLSEHTTS